MASFDPDGEFFAIASFVLAQFGQAGIEVLHAGG